MSKERPTSTRRQFVKGLGGAAGITSLAGCADALNGEENEPETTRREEPPEQNNTEQPVNETEQQNEQEEQTEEQGLTWEKVLEEHQESKDRRADKELIEKARNGEKPGKDYGVLFEDEEAGPVTLTGKKWYGNCTWRIQSWKRILRHRTLQKPRPHRHRRLQNNTKRRNNAKSP